jgi:hypothetical protein
MWSSFENGKTIGSKGSESGKIILDEEHCDGAIITLEEKSNIAPYAITVGIYGLFFHTIYLSTKEEGSTLISRIKNEIAAFFANPEEDSAWVEKFVSRY